MDSNSFEQEPNIPKLEFIANVFRNDLDPAKASYEVLRKLGFTIKIENETTDNNGNYLEDCMRVMVASGQRSKLDRIREILTELPEYNLFIMARDGLLSLASIRNSTEEWQGQNRRLIARAEKASKIRNAENSEAVAEMFKEEPPGQKFKTEAQKKRLEAEEIAERPLDGEGIRMILYQKTAAILDAHPELKP